MSSINRRSFLSSVSAAAAIGVSPSAWSQTRPKSITVRDPGGSYVEAFREAFYLPFEAKTGIKVVSAVAAHEPTAQIKAMVEAKTYTWDVALLARSAQQQLSQSNMLEQLNIQGSAWDDLPEAYRSPHFAGVDIYTAVLAYRTDTVKNAPTSWRDLWNVKDFPGRRALRNHPFDRTDARYDDAPSSALA